MNYWYEPKTYVLHNQAHCKQPGCDWSDESYGHNARLTEERGRDYCVETGHNVLIEIKMTTEIYRAGGDDELDSRV